MNVIAHKTIIRRQVRGVSFVNIDMFTDSFRTALGVLVTNLQVPFKMVTASLSGQTGEFEYGSRFNDVDQVVNRILCTLSSEYALWESPTPKNVADVEREERMHLGVWAWEGLRDSASSDHWYMHEKRYD